MVGVIFICARSDNKSLRTMLQQMSEVGNFLLRCRIQHPILDPSIGTLPRFAETSHGAEVEIANLKALPCACRGEWKYVPFRPVCQVLSSVMPKTL